jgi:arylformamidase
MKIYDITVPLSANLPVYPGDPQIAIDRTSKLENGDIANVSRLSMSSHTGTHVDPPSHFFSGARTLDNLALEVLIGPARVVDVGNVDCINQSVIGHCQLEGATRVLFKTKNSKLWSSRNDFDRSFVALDHLAARELVQRGIKLVGIDYLSIEKFNFDVPRTHFELLGADVIVVEGLDLSEVPPGDYELICLPLKIEDGDGAPARVVLRDLPS